MRPVPADGGTWKKGLMTRKPRSLPPARMSDWMAAPRATASYTPRTNLGSSSDSCHAADRAAASLLGLEGRLDLEACGGEKEPAEGG